MRRFCCRNFLAGFRSPNAKAGTRDHLPAYHPQTTRIHTLNCFLPLLALLAAPLAHAQTLTWDANGTGSGQTDGAAIWLGANQWWDGASNTTWNSGTPDNASIGNGGAGGTITVSSLTAGTINFGNFTGTYTISGPAGTTITTNGGITVGSNAGNVTFSGSAASLTIAGAGGITMNGSGVLQIRSNLVASYAGPTVINNGTENFFGTNPGVASSGMVAGASSGNIFTFTHPQNASPANGVTGTYRWSKDLTNFRTHGQTDADGTTVSFSAVTNAGITTVTATVTGTPADKLFVDVRVSQN
jgi:hypothetical protein